MIMPTMKDVILEKYGSINSFIEEKKKEFDGELPISREAIYKIVTHETTNPGIKSLTIVADMIGISKEQAFKEFEN